MNHDPRSLLERYLPYRRFVEPGFWILNFGLSAAVDTVIVQLDVARVHLGFAAWQPAVWEW